MNHRDTKFFFKYNKFNFWCFVEKEKTNRGGGDKWSKQMRKEGNFLQFWVDKKSFFLHGKLLMNRVLLYKDFFVNW